MPEVEDVVRRTGRAERTEDPMPHTVSDVLVVLKPERSRSLEDVPTNNSIRILNTIPTAMLPASLAFESRSGLDCHS